MDKNSFHGSLICFEIDSFGKNCRNTNSLGSWIQDRILLLVVPKVPKTLPFPNLLVLAVIVVSFVFVVAFVLLSLVGVPFPFELAPPVAYQRRL